jgi:hypothetical protein
LKTILTQSQIYQPLTKDPRVRRDPPKRARRNPRGRKKISVRNCFRQNPKTFLTAPPRLPTRCTHTNPPRPTRLAFLCASTRAPLVIDRELGVASLNVRRQEDQGHDGVPEDGRDLCPALGHGRDGAPYGVVGWEAACVEGCQTPSSPTQRPSRCGGWPASVLGSFPGAPSPGRSARLGSGAIPSTRDTESTSSGGGRGTRQWR